MKVLTFNNLANDYYSKTALLIHSFCFSSLETSEIFFTFTFHLVFFCTCSVSLYFCFSLFCLLITWPLKYTRKWALCNIYHRYFYSLLFVYLANASKLSRLSSKRIVEAFFPKVFSWDWDVYIFCALAGIKLYSFSCLSPLWTVSSLKARMLGILCFYFYCFLQWLIF